MSVQSKIAPEAAKTTNPKVLAFVEQAKTLFKPEQVVWCDGSKAEYQAMRGVETPHFRVWWLMEQLGRDPYDRAGALLRASSGASPTVPSDRARARSTPCHSGSAWITHCTPCG